MGEHMPRRPRIQDSGKARAGRPARFLAGLRPVTIFTAALATVLLASQAAAAVPAGGTKGDPQPELAQFKVGAAGQAGSGAVLPDGTLVLAAPSKSGNAVHVCVLHPGNRKCASTTTLPPQSGDTLFEIPEVLPTGGHSVSIVVYDCCNSTPDNVFVYHSTDDGKSFSHFVRAGTIAAVGAGTVANGQLVVATSDNNSLQVQAFPANPSGPTGSFAEPNGKQDADTYLTTYKGGVLVASDDDDNVYVEYAASGSNFNASGSYKSVATLKHQIVTGLSGNALLTDPGGSLTGGERLLFFNGKSFGTSHKVPDSKAGDDGYFAMQETGKVVHVFFEGRRDHYDLISETTSNGTHWSSQQRYGTAITSTWLAPVLGHTGSGLVFESGSLGAPLLAQPILNPQRVHISLRRSKVPAGHSTKLTGQATPHLNHQTVKLEDESHGRWYVVKTAHESASGKFSFTVPGRTRTYRAVVADKPGYYLYGYSGSVKLTAVKH
jgi:hypothetical protein